MAKGKKQNRGSAPQKANIGKKKIRKDDDDDDHEVSSVDDGISCSWLSNPRNLGILCAASSLMLYWNTHACGFVYDDHVAIVQNYDIKGITPLSALWQNDFWGQRLASVGSCKSFRPLTVLSFRINHMLSGMNASSFHAWNNFINALAVYASVWTVIAVLGGTKKQQVNNSYSLVVSCILYAFHPIHTEAVANTVGRAELLGALLEFIAFWCHYRSMQSSKVVTPYFLASLVLAFVSALAKEPCLMVLAICGANEIASNWLPMTYSKGMSSSDRKRLRQSVIRFLLLAFTGMVYILMRVIINGESMEIKPKFKDNPLLFADNKISFLLTALHIQALYAWKLVYPFNFSCDYGFDAIPMVESFGDARNFGTLVWAAALAYLLFQGLRKARDKSDSSLLIALAWILAPLLPASHIIPLGTVLAERLLYVPSLGYSILVGLAVEHILDGKRKEQYLKVAAPLLFLVLAVCAHAIIHRNLDWRTDEALWEANYASYPRNVKTATTHARVLVLEGDYNQAWHITKKAYEQLPNDLPNLITYAKTTARSDAGGRDYAKAQELLDEGIRIVGERGDVLAGDYKLYSTKADLLRLENRLEEAKSFHLEALKVLSPTDARDPTPHCNVGEIETLLGSWEDSLGYMEKCVAMSKVTSEEDDEDHLHRLGNLGKVYCMTKQWDKAEVIFREVVKHRENPDIQRLLDYLIEQKKKIEEASKSSA